ncbi:MAG: cyclic nucleotide-binding domain-containing protein [Chloroflexi bacterium]|nr:cyclic nucleotide-binding domain-containing protein [Chloroflexota bacterium]
MTLAPGLTNSVLLAGLEHAQLERIAAITRVVDAPRGTIVIREGDLLKELYIIEQGTMKLTMDARLWEGSTTLRCIVNVIGPYGAVGWSALVEPNLATLSAQAKTDCRLLAINGQRFLGLMDQDPVMGHKVMKALAGLVADRLEATRQCLLSEKVADLMRHPVMGRVLV